MNTRVTLFLPGLLAALSEQQDLPALRLILSKASVCSNDLTSTEACLKAFFNGLGDKPIPYAALGAYYYGEQGGKQWCFASPVECCVDHQTAYLRGNAHLDLSGEEQESLLADLNYLFNQDGMTLMAKSAHEWYCALTQPADIMMHDLNACLNKSLHDLLPTGPDQPYWRRLFSECEMLLNGTRVNQQRSQANKPRVSSLWFWGIGTLPEKVTTAFDCVISAQPAILGLCKLAGVPCESADSVDFEEKLKKYHHILWIDFDMNIKKQTENCFASVLSAFKASQIQEMMMQSGKGKQWTLSRKNKWFFWRKIKSMSDILKDVKSYNG